MATPFSCLSSMSPPPCSEPVQLTVSPAETTLSFATEQVIAQVKTEPATPKPEEKKPVKKRKSWGQELPTPKTNLPPRKRAKTEDEKEQRRIERVLRNRAAAQTSRERKRLEVEKLEGEKLEMEHQNGLLLRRLAQMEAENNRLSQQVAQLSAEIRSSRGSSPQSMVSGLASPTLAPILLKQERDEMISSLDKIPFPTPSMSSYSPSVKGCDLIDSSDMTQHPAAMLCDLQCQSEEWQPSTAPHQAQQQPPQASPSLCSTPATATSTSPLPLQQPQAPPQQLLFNLAVLSIIQHLFQMMTSTAYSTLLIPLTQIFRSLKQGSPLTFSPAEIQQHLPLILWLISTPTLSTFSTTSTTPTKPHRRQHSEPPTTNRPVFRIHLLTRLLACSPALARPLRDATSKAFLQLVASGGVLDFGSLLAASSSGSAPVGRGDGDVDVGSRPVGYELLLTMIWAIDCIERAKARKCKQHVKGISMLSMRSQRTLESRTRFSRSGSGSGNGVSRAWIKFQTVLGNGPSRNSSSSGSGSNSRSKEGWTWRRDQRR
ncbi:hypothetical protein RJZ56_008076 [Blastomyces dermatitidis]|uniref:BZIP transcription factor HacA n=2 Tax=Ajellomyces dermatitidis TaxID=5039 RepID=F2TNQ6_AJEDA|nr:bZIP transcription factor HacA [Blastomyces dermatitidis ER-3]EEQ86128.1 bZIP transcription factor HacA [Blastomyces dermatitidis ER-3]EGE84869.1 BZIP transcription factor HacA [Blastomyces dermatitidis ATCC 18188]EQL29816.1 hypothetical protein BDFG_07597 [Blastomyces dermatitidis ATCC 26199]